MRVRPIFFVVLFGLLAIFASLNWAAFTAPTSLSLGVTSMQAPLGLVMLGFLVFLSALFLVFVVYLQTTVLLDARRQSKELQAQRELADKAEASRFTELRRFLETELTGLGTQADQNQQALLARMEKLDSDVRATVEQTGTTLTAYIGELEDRLERETTGLAPRITHN